MNIFIKKENFDIENIYIKKNNKIIYNLNNIQLLGIPISITNFTHKIINNIIHINLLDDDDILFFQKLDDYFKNKFKNFRSFFSNNKITVKCSNISFITDEIHININSLKTKEFIYYLNIITI